MANRITIESPYDPWSGEKAEFNEYFQKLKKFGLYSGDEMVPSPQLMQNAACYFPGEEFEETIQEDLDFKNPYKY